MLRDSREDEGEINAFKIGVGQGQANWGAGRRGGRDTAGRSGKDDADGDAKGEIEDNAISTILASQFWHAPLQIDGGTGQKKRRGEKQLIAAAEAIMPPD
jgi:hypothetical protein